MTTNAATTGGDKSIAHFYIYDIEEVFLLNPKEILFT